MQVNSMGNAVNASQVHLRAGDWVEVRSKEEILRTLDKKGQLEGLPFMPEMFRFCGRRFRVYKSAHKTCDTVYEYKGRSMTNAVHLEDLRCNGVLHGGCEASCLIFWKTAWLRKVGGDSDNPSVADQQLTAGEQRSRGCTEADVLAGTRRSTSDESEPCYVCQATELPAATKPLRWWAWRQYAEDYSSGNVAVGRIIKSFAYMAYRHGLVNLGIGIGPALMWLYDRVQSVRRGTPYPHRNGRLPIGARTPANSLELMPGECVRVKSFEEIRVTCDVEDTNRGMKFDAEMVPYCGGTYRVLKRVSRIVNEKTGKMQIIKNPCIILEGVVCQARFSSCRLFCPRNVYPYWRECWLERVNPDAAPRRSPS